MSPEGRELAGVEGRLMNPGYSPYRTTPTVHEEKMQFLDILDEESRVPLARHAIECGWFLLDLATRAGDAALANTAVRYLGY